MGYITILQDKEKLLDSFLEEIKSANEEDYSLLTQKLVMEYNEKFKKVLTTKYVKDCNCVGTSSTRIVIISYSKEGNAYITKVIQPKPDQPVCDICNKIWRE